MAIPFISGFQSQSGSNVTYFDVEMQRYDGDSNAEEIESSTIFKIWMVPTSNNLYPRLQVLASNGAAYALSYQSIYQYASTVSYGFNTNTTTISPQYGAYNDSQGNHHGTHIYLQMQSKAASSDGTNIIKMSMHHYRSSYAFHEYFTVLPYYSSSSVQNWATARFYYNTTGSAQVSAYQVFGGV